jgi:CBS domain-containing protein
MKVKEIMSQPVVTIPVTASLADAAKVMLERGIGCLPVVAESGELVGLITESSFAAKSVGVPFSTFRAPQVLGKWLSPDDLEKIYESARSTPVADVMVRSVVTITEDEPVASAVELMLKHDINRLPVVRDGVPVGIIARHDLLRMMIDCRAVN